MAQGFGMGRLDAVLTNLPSASAPKRQLVSFSVELSGTSSRYPHVHIHRACKHTHTHTRTHDENHKQE